MRGEVGPGCTRAHKSHLSSRAQAGAATPARSYAGAEKARETQHPDRRPRSGYTRGAAMRGEIKKTYCRICEAHCGLEAEVGPQEQLLTIRPDKEHPVSRGYACVKGTRLAGLHVDPDRLNFPQKRVDGRLQRISWAQAIEEIGARVREIQKTHGPRSIGMYQGNPTYFSFQNILYSGAFVEALHSPNLFASHSVDVNNKFEVSTHMYGRSLVHPVPDFDHIETLICLGTNPAVSQMSVVQVGDVMAKFDAIEARGGKVVMIDPRRTETAKRVGEHHFIVPGTDVYLLLGMLHRLVQERSIDLSAVRRVADGVDEFVGIARDWSPERVAPITGIEAATIRALADMLADSGGAALYMSTGVNMGPFGSLAYWLLQGLNLITDNVDRRGGLLVPRGAFDALKLAGWLGLGGVDEHRTLVSNWHRVAGCFPAGALAEEIDNDHPERIRALFVSAGNPVQSVPNGQALEQALDKLDLLVAVDIYPSDTARHADYLLPATDMLERSDFPASHALLQAEPYAQFTEAVVSPKFERRPEWRIYSDLAVACGAKALGKSVCNVLPHLNRWLDRLPGLRAVEPDDLLALLLRWGRQTTLAELRKHPSGVRLAPNQPGSFLGHRVPTKHGRVQLWPEPLRADLPRLERDRPRPGNTGELRLIGRRQRRSHNSWMHNQPEIRQPDGNVALMHPQDAEARGIDEGDSVEIASAQGSVVIPVELTLDVMPGVVAVPHGWGDRTPELRQAHRLGGANINRVIPGGSAHLDPVSGQAIMVAHTVQVRRADAEADDVAAAQ